VVGNKKVKQYKLKKDQQGSLPKPPLHKKNFLLETSAVGGNGQSDTAEALLKMADEGLASIE
jgi:hypothetical protein